MFREHLTFARESEPNAAESVQPNARSPRDIDRKVTPARSSPTHCTFTRSHCTEAVPSFMIHLERQVLPMCEGFVRRSPHPNS